MNKGENQSFRILSMYDRFRKGEGLSKSMEAINFCVNEKTIQRDFEHIRDYLEKEVKGETIKYDRKDKVYRIEGNGEQSMNSSEIFSIAKILIESRAFPKENMNNLINKLIMNVPSEEQKFMKDLLLNEMFYYVDLQHKKWILDSIWQLAQAIYHKQIIMIQYKLEQQDTVREHKIKPLGIIFADYYFYIIAYRVGSNYQTTTTFRIDRITDIRETNERFKISYTDRFQEGEFRKRTQYMFSGDLLKVKFMYTGNSSQSVKDRLPTANIIEETNSGKLFEVEIYENGIKMWLLTQGEHVEVLEPIHLRDEMRAITGKMALKYIEEEKENDRTN